MEFIYSNFINAQDVSVCGGVWVPQCPTEIHPQSGAANFGMWGYLPQSPLLWNRMVFDERMNEANTSNGYPWGGNITQSTPSGSGG